MAKIICIKTREVLANIETVAPIGATYVLYRRNISFFPDSTVIEKLYWCKIDSPVRWSTDIKLAKHMSSRTAIAKIQPLINMDTDIEEILKVA